MATSTHEEIPPAQAAASAAAEEETIDVHLPDPSIWPLVIAIGMTLLLTGIVIHLAVVIVGLLLFAAGIAGWLYQDIQVQIRDRDGDHH